MFSPTGRAMVMKFGLVSLELISILSAAIAFRAEDSRLNLVTPPIIHRRWTRFSIWTRFPPSVRPNSGTVLSLLLSVYHPRGWGTFAGLGTGALAALGAAEEVIFRAYFFRLLSMATGTWIAVLVSSAHIIAHLRPAARRMSAGRPGVAPPPGGLFSAPRRRESRRL